MKTYETIIITKPDLPESDEKTLIDGMVSIIAEREGSLHINDRMGRRRLAYPIRKFEDGVYTRFLYDSVVEVPHELERRLRLSDQVLRSLTIRMEPDWAEASKIQAVKDIERRAEMEIEAARQAEEEAKRAAEAAEAAAAAPAVEEAAPVAETAAEPEAAAPEVAAAPEAVAAPEEAPATEAPAEPTEPTEPTEKEE